MANYNYHLERTTRFIAPMLGINYILQTGIMHDICSIIVEEYEDNSEEAEDVSMVVDDEDDEGADVDKYDDEEETFCADGILEKMP
ncbi:hypothetical protein INT47_005719 [Mucor saturninus]|uniref:Uncharacterized protein n=1 Tax=Mucor saturninus TaxID=64648 RepID=A0A8H7QI17_9FUNG|nr:hypothetical protein INT47_005719 [Mucor saturninus]